MKTLNFEKDEKIKSPDIEMFDDNGATPKWIPCTITIAQLEDLNTMLLKQGAHLKSSNVWAYFIHQNSAGYHFLYRYKVIE